MLSDEMACHPCNPFPAQVFHSKKRLKNVYGEDIEVDYRGDEVTVPNFLKSKKSLLYN
jgi:phosphatidylinositol glycan class K